MIKEGLRIGFRVQGLGVRHRNSAVTEIDRSVIAVLRCNICNATLRLQRNVTSATQRCICNASLHLQRSVVLQTLLLPTLNLNHNRSICTERVVYTPNPKPQTSNPKPQTSNPKPQTLNPEPLHTEQGVRQVFQWSAASRLVGRNHG